MKDIADYRIKLGATDPPLRATLLDKDGNPVDLSNAIGVVLEAVLYDDKDISFGGPCDILESEGPGVVEFIWFDAQPQYAGFYKVQFWVSKSGGSKEPFPGDGHLRIEVTTP